MFVSNAASDSSLAHAAARFWEEVVRMLRNSNSPFADDDHESSARLSWTTGVFQQQLLLPLLAPSIGYNFRLVVDSI